MINGFAQQKFRQAKRAMEEIKSSDQKEEAVESSKEPIKFDSHALRRNGGQNKYNRLEYEGMNLQRDW